MHCCSDSEIPLGEESEKERETERQRDREREGRGVSNSKPERNNAEIYEQESHPRQTENRV